MEYRIGSFNIRGIINVTQTVQNSISMKDLDFLRDSIAIYNIWTDRMLYYRKRKLINGSSKLIGYIEAINLGAHLLYEESKKYPILGL